MIMAKTKTKTIYILEYFSATLILSYFFIHNIFLVIIGTIFSLFLINIRFINSIIRWINKNLVIKKECIDQKINDKEINFNSINMKSSKEDTQLTLVETIEELGFIPSIDKEDETNAA